jgi:hypothetical protein
MASMNLGNAANQAATVFQQATAGLGMALNIVNKYIVVGQSDHSDIFILRATTEFGTLQYIAAFLHQDVNVVQQHLVGDRRDTEELVGKFIAFMSHHHPGAVKIMRSYIHSMSSAIDMLHAQHDAAQAAQVALAAGQPAPAAVPFVRPLVLPGASWYFDLAGLRANATEHELGVPRLAVAVNMIITEAVALQIALSRWKTTKVKYEPDAPAAPTCTIAALQQPMKEARAVIGSVAGADADHQLALRHVAATQESKALELDSIPGIGSTFGYATATDASRVAANKAGKVVTTKTVSDNKTETRGSNEPGPNHERNKALRALRKKGVSAAGAGKPK